VNGLLTKFSDIDAFARAVEQLMDDRDRRMALVKQQNAAPWNGSRPTSSFRNTKIFIVECAGRPIESVGFATLTAAGTNKRRTERSLRRHSVATT
jgi:hypothetical protein